MDLYFNRQPDFTHWLIGSGLIEEPFVVIDVGCQGGAHPCWDALGDCLELHGFDPVEEVIVNLRAQGHGAETEIITRLPWAPSMERWIPTACPTEPSKALLSSPGARAKKHDGSRCERSTACFRRDWSRRQIFSSSIAKGSNRRFWREEFNFCAVRLSRRRVGDRLQTLSRRSFRCADGRAPMPCRS